MRILFGIVLICSSLSLVGQDLGYEKGELLIQFNPQVNSTNFQRKIEMDLGLKMVFFKELSDIGQIYHIQFADSTLNLDQTIRILYDFPEVKIVQKNHFVTNRETVPDDTFIAEQWYLKNTGLDGGIVDADIDATDAWDITTGGLTTHNDTIVVCVIEGGGVDIFHEDIAGNIWRNLAEIADDGIDNDGNGYIDDVDGWNVLTENDAVGSGSHGTRVSGMIGAVGNNSTGVSGVNWNVKMMIIKGQQASNESSVIAAYSYPLKMRKMYNDSYGTEGAFVVATNSSWGIDNGDPADSPLWCAMYDLLGEEGVLSVGATTNSNVNVEVSGDMPTNCTSDYFIGVTMSNNVDLRAGSGYGITSVDLAAPGNAVKLPVPGNIYTSTSGTSFATPCVTGSIALAYSAPCAEFISFVKFDPAAAALQMKAYILDGVDIIPSLGSEVLTGGRLNVNNSISLMMDGCDLDACIQPFNIRSSLISDTSVVLIWDGLTEDFILTIQPTGGVASSFILDDISSFSFDTLTPCTEYTITIQADCGIDGLSEPSYPHVFTTDGCCINPPIINSFKSENELEIEWSEILYATQYNVRYAMHDSEDWIELLDVESPLTINDLNPCEIYDFQIYTLCADSTRGYSESFEYRTLGCGVCTELTYCSVIGANDNLEWIDSVSINGVTKFTGPNGGWLQSESIITALTPGESYLIQVTPDFAESTFTERYSIYIDFNQNGEFDLPGERLINDVATSGTLNQMLLVPLSAELGITKMRIGMSALSEPIACPTESFFGEYEDYCVYIGPQLNIDEEVIELFIFPNPARNQIQIQGNVKIESIIIYTIDGQIVYEDNSFNSSSVPVEFLSDGLYIVHLQTEHGLVTSRFVKQ